MLLPETWTFVDRLALLLIVLLAFALVDWARHRERAERWREYLFLAATGGVAAVFGSLTDLVTSSVSPDYFITGKGLSGDAGFRLEVLKLGAQAGLVGGVVIGSVFLLVNQPRRNGREPPLRLGRLLVGSWRVFACAIVAAIAAGSVAAISTPAWFEADLAGVLEPAAIQNFTVVFCTHLGIYVGAAVGVGVSIRSIRRARASTTLELPVKGRP